MRILYLGATFEHSTSAHRAGALRRLGHQVVHVDPRRALPKGRLIGGLSVRLGFGVFTPLVLRYLKATVNPSEFDLAWVDGCPELGPAAYRWMKQTGLKVVNYNVDDPFSIRDGRKWTLYKAAVRRHDLTAVVRTENITEARDYGAAHVVRVYRSYDPVAHAAFGPSEEDRQKYSSEVSFIGTWMPERGPFLSRLLELGVPLSIWGDRWQKAPEWSRLRTAWRGPGLYGRDFAAATLCSKVALGLLSKGNRDLHTTRSAEVPYLGGPAFCAERTPEHMSMFKEGAEAVFWSSAEECSLQCSRLLADDRSREAMVKAAKHKIHALGLSNDRVMAFLLHALASPKCEAPASTVFGSQLGNVKG